MTRRFRTLRPDERRLWAQVARAVSPLAGRSLPEPEPPAPTPPPPVALPAPAALSVRPPPNPTPGAPPPAPLDRKVRMALRRGTLAVDAVLDLHGMRQSEAHGALNAFLHRARARDHGLVLIVTGKGGGVAGSGGDAPFEERGVLRRVVPHWLRLSDLRTLVLGFEEASPQHGGSGALYVRLRRRRAISPP